VVVVDAVGAGIDDQDKHLDPGNIHIELLGAVPALQDAALVELLAVGQNLEPDASLLGDLIIDADPSGELAAATIKLDVQSAVGVGAEAMLERPAADFRDCSIVTRI
jgi:hypothetical protein